MNFPESNPEYQILLANINTFTQENSALLSKLCLEISLKSSLSNQHQVYQFFSSTFEIPIDITSKILSHLPVTYLYTKLDCDFNQLQLSLEKTGYEEFVDELTETKGFHVYFLNLV